MADTYKIIEVKCIENLYIGTQKVFTKNNIYIAKQYNDTIAYKYLLVNDLNEQHFVTGNIDLWHKCFKEIKNKLKLEDQLMDIEKPQYTYQEVIDIIQEGETYVHVLGNSSIKKITKKAYSIDFDIYKGNIPIMIFNSARFQKLKEKEYMTFDEARKLGIPKHKDYGYTPIHDVRPIPGGVRDAMQNFIDEMDKKVWEVED